MKREQTQQGGANAWVDIVQSQVESLQFGVVQIVVHEGRVVQIERTEKLRFSSSRTGKGGEAQE